MARDEKDNKNQGPNQGQQGQQGHPNQPPAQRGPSQQVLTTTPTPEVDESDEGEFPVHLSDHFLFEGGLYGPGEITVTSKRVAQHLERAEKRVARDREKNGVGTLKINGLMTGILPNTLVNVMGAEAGQINNVRPEHIEQQRQVSEQAAQAARRRELELLDAAMDSGEKRRPGPIRDKGPAPDKDKD